MQLFESGEMYLETILILTKSKEESAQKGAKKATSKVGVRVRAIDISEAMEVSKPSVSRALGNLKEGGFVTVEENGDVKLTKTGRKIAEKIYERHTSLTEFFVKLGVPKAIASEDACKIEHVISDESFKAICKKL